VLRKRVREMGEREKEEMGRARVRETEREKRLF
jgi:hypothetical protein